MNMPMQPMAGTTGMMGAPGMGMAPGGAMGVAPGMYPPAYPQGGFATLDPDCYPGAVTLDVGNPYCYPHHAMGAGMEMEKYQRTPQPLPTPTPEVYVVQKGDSVYKIAKRYGTTMRAIILANNLTNPDLIYPGQVLYIPGV
jgi:nucleoid-associated protein YgaU